MDDRHQPEFGALVWHTRVLVRHAGFTEIDDAFSQPTRQCGWESNAEGPGESEWEWRPGRIDSPDAFRDYLDQVLAFLDPIRASTAQGLLSRLNRELVTPLQGAYLATEHQRFDLLDPQTYAGHEVLRFSLASIRHQLGWGPDPGPDGNLSPEDEPLPEDLNMRIEELLGQIEDLQTELDADAEDHMDYLGEP